MQALKLLRAGAVAIVAVSYAAHAQDEADQSLRLYAVNIIEGLQETRSGYGVYLGNGLILTASHVAAGLQSTIKVEIAGQTLSTEMLKRGQFSDIDLALISIDATKLPVSLRLRRAPLCKRAPWPGERVIVAIPDAVAQSHVIPRFLLPLDLAPKFRTAISDVATTGNSGSGVFDANEKCLLGIISAKIQAFQTTQQGRRTVREKKDVAKYFVPSPVIAAFIPPQYRF